MLPSCDLGALHCILSGAKEGQEAANVTAAYGDPAFKALWEFFRDVFLRCFPGGAGRSQQGWREAGGPAKCLSPDAFDMQQFWERCQVKTENKFLFTIQIKLV